MSSIPRKSTSIAGFLMIAATIAPLLAVTNSGALAAEPEEMGAILCEALAIPADQIVASSFQVYDGPSLLPASSLEGASPGEIEGSALITNGNAEDGGLGDTDWGGTDKDLGVFDVSLIIPADAMSLRFTTQYITAEYAASRIGNDQIRIVAGSPGALWESEDLNATFAPCAGPETAAISHAIDLRGFAFPDTVFQIQFHVQDMLDGQYDSSLLISNFRFSTEIVPEPDDPLPPDQPFHWFHYHGDTHFGTGSYTYTKELISIEPDEFMPLRFAVTYNSSRAHFIGMGQKWTHSFEVHAQEMCNGDVIIRKGNATSAYYTPDGMGGYESQQGPNSGTLEHEFGNLVYTTPTHLEYVFVGTGLPGYHRLLRISDPNGNSIFASTAVGAPPIAELRPKFTVWGQSEQIFDFDLIYEPDYKNLISVEVNGHVIADFTYNENDELTSIVEPEGVVTSFTYDQDGNLQTITNGEGEVVVDNTYEDGLVVSQLDPRGGQDQFAYFEDRVEIRDRLGRLTTKRYDIQGQLIEVEHPHGAITRYTYDADGNVTSITDQAGQGTTREYDDDGNLIVITDIENATIEMSYDDRGNVVSRTDQDGKTSSFEYDSLDNLIRKVDPLGNQITYTYNARGQKSATTDKRGNVTRYFYDTRGFLERLEEPEGRTTHFEYDDLGRQTSVTDPNGNTTGFIYDELGRLTHEIRPGGLTTAYTYDRAGRRIYVLKENPGYFNDMQFIEYTATGHVESWTNGLGHTVQYEYDDADQLLSMTDQEGRQTAYSYDSAGRLDGVLDPENGTGGATYDDCNRKSVTDPNGVTRRYTYDALGRATLVTGDDGQSLSYEYNGAGLVTSRTNSRGQRLDFTYDDASRLVRTTMPGQTVSHTLDPNGNKIFSNGVGFGSVARTFDGLNRMTSRTDEFGKTIRYEHDPGGNLTTLTYSDGKTVTYTYDSDNRMKTVTDWNGRVTRYDYQPIGLIASVQLPDSSVVTYEYDAGQRLKAINDHDKTGAPIFEVSFTLNRVGDRTQAVVDLPMDPTIPDWDSDFEYTANLISNYDGHDFSYDGDGNMVNGFINGQSRTMDYDPLNNLTRFGTDTYQYDVDGYRIARTIDGQTTTLVYDAIHKLPRLLEEYDGQGNIIARYVHGLGLISREDTAGTLSVYHYDSRGSTVALTDADGDITDTYAYGPYGALLADAGNTPNAFNYGGQFGVMDDGNGLRLMKSRYYSSELMRFIQKDRAYNGNLESTQSLNLHVYVEGNPILRLDPSGEFLAEFISILVTGSEVIGNGDLFNWDNMPPLVALGAGLYLGACLTAIGAPVLVAFLAADAAALVIGNVSNMIVNGEWSWSWKYSTIGGAISFPQDQYERDNPSPAPTDYFAIAGGDYADVTNDFWPDTDSWESSMGWTNEARIMNEAYVSQPCPYQQ